MSNSASSIYERARAVRWDGRLSMGARVLALELLDAAGRSGVCFLKRVTLAQRLGVSTRTVSVYISELERSGLITTEHSNGSWSPLKFKVQPLKNPASVNGTTAEENLSGTAEENCNQPLKKSAGTAEENVHRNRMLNRQKHAACNFPSTMAAAGQHFAISEEFVAKLVQAAREVKPDVTDSDLAAAVGATYRDGQRSAGLWLTVVPEFLKHQGPATRLNVPCSYCLGATVVPSPAAPRPSRAHDAAAKATTSWTQTLPRLLNATLATIKDSLSTDPTVFVTALLERGAGHDSTKSARKRAAVMSPASR